MPSLPKVHRPAWADKAKAASARERVKRNQGKRQYTTWDATWRKMRKIVLAEEPLCRECMKQGRITAGNQVDHMDGNSHNNARINLQVLCVPCHARKTSSEMKR
jgi:5-methylcytosine-specific restriction endonuclease McrA